MSFTLQWVGVILVAGAIDLAVRFGWGPEFTGVLWVEAVLLPLTGIALHLVFRLRPKPSGYRRVLQVVLVWAFLLAGLRAGIWAAGFPVPVANLVVFLVAFLAWFGFWILRRQRGKADGRS